MLKSAALAPPATVGRRRRRGTRRQRLTHTPPVSSDASALAETRIDVCLRLYVYTYFYYTFQRLQKTVTKGCVEE